VKFKLRRKIESIDGKGHDLKECTTVLKKYFPGIGAGKQADRVLELNLQEFVNKDKRFEKYNKKNMISEPEVKIA